MEDEGRRDERRETRDERQQLTTHTFSVSVANQLSDAGDGVSPTDLMTSYAPPVINLPNPALFSTAGGVQVTLTGTNLGCISAATPVVTFGSTPIQAFPKGEDILTFLLPEGEGTNIPVVLTVGGQASTPERLFNYKPPTIESVHSVQAEGDTVPTIIILGDSFSTTPLVYLQPTGSGVVPPALQPLQCVNSFPNAAGVQVVSHSEIHCTATHNAGNLWVKVGVRDSNVVAFETGNPSVIFNSLDNAHTGAGGVSSPTSGGKVLEILCQYCGDNPAGEREASEP